MRRIIVLASLVSLLVGLAPLSASADFPYYTQFRDASGITVKAPSVVDPRALDVAVQVVEQMLRGRDDIRGRLVQQEAALAIIPKASFVTELPEFAGLSGRIDRNGNAYDSFAIRGLGAVRGQPVSATSEENLLGLPGDPFWAESIAHHEFAHAVMNLGFTTDDLDRWTQINYLNEYTIGGNRKVLINLRITK